MGDASYSTLTVTTSLVVEGTVQFLDNDLTHANNIAAGEVQVSSSNYVNGSVITPLNLHTAKIVNLVRASGLTVITQTQAGETTIDWSLPVLRPTNFTAAIDLSGVVATNVIADISEVSVTAIPGTQSFRVKIVTSETKVNLQLYIEISYVLK